jgi:hypothetical protein
LQQYHADLNYWEGEVERALKRITECQLRGQKLQDHLVKGFTAPEIDFRLGVTETVFEKAVTTDRDFIVGFIDVWAEIATAIPYPWGLSWSGEKYQFTDRYRDNAPYPHIAWQRRVVKCAFEVKPKIPSLGELLRQLRTYQTHQGADDWVVVSPDVRWKGAIESQGFTFWECPPL